MSVQSNRAPQGPTLSVPDVSAAGDGSGGVVLGLGGKQLAVAALVAGTSLAVVAAAAGAAFFVLSDDDAGTAGDPDLDLVPAGADTITYTNADEARSDEALRQVADTWFGLENATPPDSDAALAGVENQSGLDPEGLHHVTAFSRYEEETGEGAREYSATILRTDWSEDAFVAAVEDDETVSLEERSYGGATVYAPEEDRFGPETWVAVLGEGTYVVGTKNATRDVVDVERGEMEPFDGELRSAFTDTRSGYLRFASRVPEEQVPEGSDGINTSSYRNVTVVSGSFYTTDEALGVEMTMRAATEDDARDVHDVTDGSVSLLAGLSEVDELQEELREVEVERDGTDVVVTYESPVEQVEELLRAMDEAGEEDDDAETVERNVQAGAAVQPDDERDEVTVTWTSNQNADLLRVDFSSLDGPDDTARLSEVGDAYTYEGQDGTTVTVTVTAVAGDRETVIYSRQVEL